MRQEDISWQYLRIRRFEWTSGNYFRLFGKNPYICKNMGIEIFRAFLVGICAAVPAGPVLLLVLQKTLGRGRCAGILTGLGSALVDTIFAAIGLFALSLVDDFITRHEATVMEIGGGLIILIGLGIFLKGKSVPADKPDENGGLSLFGCTLQAAGTAISNPAALAYVLGLLSVLGLVAGGITAPVWAVLLAVACGEMVYWSSLVLVISRWFRVRAETLTVLGKIAGAGIMCFGIVLIIKGILF